MNFFRIIILSIILVFSGQQILFADSHDTTKNIVDQAKEINQDIQNNQAATEENIESEIGSNEEEDVPLNDPFAGNAASSSTTGFSMNNNSDEPEDEMSLYNFKLVGIISGQYESYISLVDSSGKAIVIQLNEELKEGLRLVDMRLKEAIFQKEDETYMIIDFKNQIREADEY